MPLVTISSWKNETRTSSAGNEYDCTVFSGTKHGYDGAEDEPWEKPMVEWADSEWIDEIRSYEFPAKLLIKNEKEGKHWRIVSIEPWDGTKRKRGGEQGPVPVPSEGGPTVPNVPVVTQNLIASNNIMVDCMREATNLVRGMMDNAETFKSMIKKSASTELVVQLTKDIANELYRTVTGKDDKQECDPAEVKSDPSGLEPTSEEVIDVEVPF